MVIDTDILIDHFHGNAAATVFIEEVLIAGSELFISVATVAEILAGMRPGEEEDTEALLSLFSVYPADEPLARMAGAYLNRYAASHALDLGDALIAATARATASELYTRNLRHYPMDDIVVKAPYERGR
jgi:predicted nucleic acid-binding protein